MFEALSIITLFLSSYVLVRILGVEGFIDRILIFFCVTVAQIVSIGQLLSAVSLLSSVKSWAVLGTIIFLALAGTALLRGNKLSSLLPGISLKALMRSVLSLKKWSLEETSGFEKRLLTPMIITTLSLGILNLIIIIFAAPHNYDGMSHHLARMAYYLQHGNMDYYSANYWPQVAKMKSTTLLFIYCYLMSHMNENLTQLVQFVSYWVAICSVYGIARKTGSNRTHSLFASLVSSLLIVWLLESNTNQNDMITAAFAGTAIYFLFSFKETRKSRDLTFAAFGIGLSLSISAKTLLSLPSIFLVACYVLFRNNFRRNAAYFMLSLLLAVALFALPAGYIENYQRFGNPLGPEGGGHVYFGMVEDEEEDETTEKYIDYVMQNGTKNLLRLSFEFLRLEGLPPVDFVLKVKSMIRTLPRALVDWLGIDLESPDAVIKPFRYQKPFIFFSHEDWSSWGPLGFSLVWIIVFLSAIGIIKSGKMKILSYAAILFILVIAFGLSYEPHYGRYFVTGAVFAVPPAAVAFGSKRKIIRVYLTFVVLLACITAVSAIVLRPARPPVSMKDLAEKFPVVKKFEFLRRSIFEMERVAQLTTNNRAYYEAIKMYDLLVPDNATVAVFLYGDTYEYPLFGKNLTRTIIPVNPYVEGFKGIPDNADYLLYARGFPYASSNDLYLGANWYLRRLSVARDDAVEYFNAALKFRPGHAPYRNRLGIEYAKKKMYDKAIEEFKEAVRLNPDESSYRFNLDKALRFKNSTHE